MDPNQLLTALAPQIKAMARVEADRAALAVYEKARRDMIAGFVLAALAGGAIGHFWK